MSSAPTATTVLLTGASGFIASHIVKQLLERGFNVIGTVRSQAKADYFLEKYGKDAPLKFAIVEDIVPAGAFDKVLKENPEITAVLHTASPFHFNATDNERDLFIPAVNGTRNILEGIKKYAPQVKKVVITSSFAALRNATGANDPTFTYTEKVWNPITREEGQTADPASAYMGSKKFAEKAAWEFLEENKDQVNFNITTINPPYVWGPVENKLDINALNTSNAALFNVYVTAKKVLEEGKDNGDVIPGHFINWIDVRDVAWAHIEAISNPRAVNQRWWISPGIAAPQRLVNLLHQEFPELAGKIAVGNPAKPDVDISTHAAYDNHQTNEQSGIKYTDLRTTVKDAFTQFLAASKL